MRSAVMMGVALAIAATACGDRSEQRAQDDDASARMEERRDGNTESPDVASGPPTASDQPNNETDLELIATIRRDLVADDTLSTSAQNVTIVADGGNVTLQGRVESADEKARVEAAARQAPGVRQIDNQIEVAP
jgi:hyperosmotically inducible periplasmic protein